MALIVWLGAHAHPKAIPWWRGLSQCMSVSTLVQEDGVARPPHKAWEWGGAVPPEGTRGTQAAPCTVLLCRPADLAALLPDLSGRLLINSVFHVGAERLQQMLFSDSSFLQDFLQQCKFTGQRLSWPRYRGGRGKEQARRPAGTAVQIGCGGSGREKQRL